MASLEKVTLRFGIRTFENFGGGAMPGRDGSHAGIPDPDLHSPTASTAIIPPTIAAWAAAPISNPFTADGAALENIALELAIPQRFRTEGPVTCISIAPDSPLESCDLYIEGTNHPHRVSVGCPYFGEIDEHARILVAPNRDVPYPRSREQAFATMTDVQSSTEVCRWDMPAVQLSAFGHLYSTPLRLNVYRGVVQAAGMQRRARYTANLAWEVKDRGGAVATVPTLLMIADGRRRIRVVAGMWDRAGSVANLRVWGIEGHTAAVENVSGANLNRLDNTGYDELLAPTALTADLRTPTIFDIPGNMNPYYYIQATIESANIGLRGYLTIHAWDE